MRNETSAVLNNEEVGGETRLWQAVVAGAIQEWISGPARHQRDAEYYLFHNETDFPAVCSFSGMDAGRLRSRLAKFRKQDAGHDEVKAVA